MNKPIHLAIGSLIIGIAVLALKYIAYLLTGSVALYSDALESTVNIATAIMALVAVRISDMPADSNHPFGHHKAEYFSAVLEGVMIIVAALLIVRAAYLGLSQPTPISASYEGFLVNLIATAINAIWAWMLISRGQRLRSPAIVADGRHLLSDVISSGAVLVGLILAVTMDWPAADPILALVVALNILWSGWRVLRDSAGGLMDSAVSEKSLSEIRQTISQHAEGALEAHDVRTRQAGRMTFIEFHLVVPGDMTVTNAHDICDRIEQALRNQDPDRWVTIHLEPENKAKHSGIVVI